MSAIAVDSRLGRVLQRLARSAAFRAVAPHVIGHLDKAARRLSRGRFMVSDLMVPTMVLTTTGAKTGQRREVPLACLPDGDGFYVVGSNFGREHHPAWTYNLEAHPEAEVWFGGRTVAVVARRLDDAEAAALWPDILHVWPSYDFYEHHSGRHLRVYRLEPLV